MTDKSPLERAARAVNYTAELSRHGDIENPEAVARAVLMAIREPKGAMIDAGGRLSRMSKGNGAADDVLNRLNAMAIYTAMIDAALEG